MAGEYGTTSQRAPRILQELLRFGKVSVDDLAELLDISTTTVRRDLAELEQYGLLRRTHGGAIPVESLLYEPFRHDSSFGDREQVNSEEKRKIGLAAAEMIADGETIALTAGTTTTQVARSIRYRKGITIVTNAINVAMELSNCPDLTVIVTGGFLSGNWFSLLGPTAIETVRGMYFDKVFVGLDGIDIERGISVHHPDEAAINRAMIRQSRKKIAVGDHTKIGLVTTALVCPITEMDIFITGAAAADTLVAPLQAAGLEVARV